jgi:hypothetical protein
MGASLWATNNENWAVCEGHGPKGIKGYIFREGPVWRVRGDLRTIYLDQESAASAVLGDLFVPCGEFRVSRAKVNAIVRATEAVINELRADGWSVALHFAKMSR